MKYKETFEYKLAKLFVDQQDLLEGKYYTDGDKFFFRCSSTLSLPVDFEENYLPIEDYLDHSCDFDFEINESLWEEYLSSRKYGKGDFTRAWVEAEGEEFENDGSIPNWVSSHHWSEILNFARDHKDYSKIIEEVENDHHDNCIGFVIEAILQTPKKVEI